MSLGSSLKVLYFFGMLQILLTYALVNDKKLFERFAILLSISAEVFYFQRGRARRKFP